MSLLTVEEFEAVVGTGAGAITIQAVIDREEAELAHELGGALSGARTETYRPGAGYDGPIHLRRFTSAVTVTDAGASVTPRLVANGGAIERPSGTWQGDVVVTYTPNDAARVKRVLIEMVREALVPDRDREAASQRDLDRLWGGDRRRRHLIRGLVPRPTHSVIAVRTSDRITPVSS